MRPWCSSCDRPVRVCLCAQIPAQPIHSATRVVILQHPHETRHKLATVPILSRCLSNCHVIVGRRLQLGTSKLFDALAASGNPSTPAPLITASDDALALDDGGWVSCRSCGRRKRVLLLFPTPSATELGTWMLSRRENDEDLCCRSFGQEDGVQPDCCREEKDGKNVAERLGTRDVGLGFNGVCNGGVSEHIVLLVVDGTWQHAREMVKASMPFLSKFVEQVCLPHDMAREGWGMGDSNSIMRKEPFAGCVSTMEAVARTLGMLEPLNGIHIEQTLLSVLRQMVFLQASHFAPMKRRPRLRKDRPLNLTSHPSAS